MKTLSQLLEESFSMEHILNDMARIGFMDEFEIVIYTDDPGNIPHMHILDASTHGNNFSSCVKLESAEYFPHGGKYKDKFNSKQRKAFNEFMKSKPKNKRFSTNYEYACSMWNDNNSKTNVDETREQPDYTKLK